MINSNNYMEFQYAYTHTKELGTKNPLTTTCKYCNETFTENKEGSCIFCNCSITNLCTNCYERNITMFSCLYACKKCLEQVKKFNKCEICNNDKWWNYYSYNHVIFNSETQRDTHLKICECKKKICINCVVKCTKCRMKIFCNDCILSHNNIKCSDCNRSKYYCNLCDTCKNPLCNECKNRSNILCNCNFKGKCIDCYRKHFIP